VDYGDAFLGAEAAATDDAIASFDGDFKKFRDSNLRTSCLEEY